MTGRRLYEIVCDEMRRSRSHLEHWEDGPPSGGNFGPSGNGDDNILLVPPAFAYLGKREKDGWNAAAKRISGGRR